MSFSSWGGGEGGGHESEGAGWTHPLGSSREPWELFFLILVATVGL